MSLPFKTKFDEMRRNDLTSYQGDENASGETAEFYPSGSQVRNVCFVLLDGGMFFRNYAYLIGADCPPEKDKIILSFTTDIVTLSGIRLGSLFNDLMQNLPKIIICVDSRYNDIGDDEKPIVNEISVTAQ